MIPAEANLLAIAQHVVRTTPAPEKIRASLDRLEAEMLKHPQVAIVPRHYFANGLYAREITIPRGTLLTGKRHKTEHLNIVSQGEITVLTEQGPKRVKAPCTLVSQPGMKRLGYAHEDTVWTTIHANPTNERDTAVLESVLTEPMYLFDKPMEEDARCLSLPPP